MAKIVMGQHANALVVRLTEGDPATLLATLEDEAGAPVNWPATPSLQFVSARTRDDAPLSFVATVDGATATWTLGQANVVAIAAASARTYVNPETRARIILPDGGDGTVVAAGPVDWRSAWDSGSQSQRVTLTVPGGPSGVGVPAGGTTGQVLAKNSDTDYDTEWVSGGGGGAEITDLVEGYTDHGEVSGALSIDARTGHHELDATDATMLSFTNARNGRIVSICVGAGAADVSIEGVLDDVTFTDDVVTTFMHRRGDWRLMGSGGEPAIPDTTPPTAVTDLTAEGGEGELTFSFTPGVDADSTVTHRYEIYTGSPSSSSALVTTNPMTVTGLDPDDYTVRVFARSNGGDSTAVTDTFTIAAPSPEAHGTEDFNRANETNLHGLTTTTGGSTWARDLADITMLSVEQGNLAYPAYVYANKFINPMNGTNMAAVIDIGNPRVTLEADYNVTAGGRIVFVVAGASDTDSLAIHCLANGNVQLYRNESAPTTTATGAPLTGRGSLTYDGTSCIYSINDVVIIDVPVGQLTGTKIGIGSSGSNVAGLWIDNAQWDTL